MNSLMHKFLIHLLSPLHVHVSRNILLILMRSNCINTPPGIVTLKTSEFSKIIIIKLAALLINVKPIIIKLDIVLQV